ncbi:MAG: D-alanyl-D-alanine carboxypeptidase/D-alanyl-D-alanine-endopeptidase, partial [Methylococcales bacterium]|nr:D-alanyl-D-alanine carboxypeptidase/D-alanyl-D-alanine-endopeptidase [Methylococcales bacterium]
LKKIPAIIILSLLPVACSETPVIPDKNPPRHNPTVAVIQKKPSLPIKKERPFRIIKKTPKRPKAPKIIPKKSNPRAYAQYTQLPEIISARLRKLKVSENGISVYIREVSKTAPLLTFNEDIPRNPASVMKLVTTYAALGILGTNYRWPVELYATGEIKNGILEGDLILKGYGYPDFKPRDLRVILSELHRKGVSTIRGSLILDNTYFSPNRNSSADFDGKAYKFYNAQPDALLFNERISEFVVTPQKGRANIVSLYPSHNVTIINNLKLKNVKCKGRYASPSMWVKRPTANKTNVYFKGSLSSRCGNRRYRTAIAEPTAMLNGTIRKMWETEFSGFIENHRFIIAPTPKNARLLYRFKGKPVKDILPLINKKSNNVMAKQLFLSIAAKASLPANPTKGVHKIKQWFASKGLNFSELKIENGSGLSRTSQVSARHIGELLIDAYNSPNRRLLWNSLPIMGVDGTLKRRMRGTVAARRSFMKTGTLRNSRAIAGYVEGNNGATYVVVILHNGSGAKARVLATHNRLIEWTAKRYHPLTIDEKPFSIIRKP